MGRRRGLDSRLRLVELRLGQQAARGERVCPIELLTGLAQRATVAGQFTTTVNGCWDPIRVRTTAMKPPSGVAV